MNESEPGSETPMETPAADGGTGESATRKRRRGTRGGQRRRKPDGTPAEAPPVDDSETPELPEPMREGRVSAEAAERSLVRKPQIGDTRPAPPSSTPPPAKRGRGRGRGAWRRRQARPSPPRRSASVRRVLRAAAAVRRPSSTSSSSGAAVSATAGPSAAT